MSAGARAGVRGAAVVVLAIGGAAGCTCGRAADVGAPPAIDGGVDGAADGDAEGDAEGGGATASGAANGGGERDAGAAACVAVASAGDVHFARTAENPGGGGAAPIAGGAPLARGRWVELGDDARLVVRGAGGGEMTLLGPGRAEVCADDGREVRVVAGRVVAAAPPTGGPAAERWVTTREGAFDATGGGAEIDVGGTETHVRVVGGAIALHAGPEVTVAREGAREGDRPPDAPPFVRGGRDDGPTVLAAPARARILVAPSPPHGAPAPAPAPAPVTPPDPARPPDPAPPPDAARAWVARCAAAAKSADVYAAASTGPRPLAHDASEAAARAAAARAACGAARLRLVPLPATPERERLLGLLSAHEATFARALRP